MSRFRLAAKPRTLAGVTGLLVLALALVYHFFPALVSTPEPEAGLLADVTVTVQPSASQPRPAHPENIRRDAGPSVALASGDVRQRRARKRITAALSGSVAAAMSVPIPANTASSHGSLEALRERADKALKTGHLAGDDDAAGRLYARVLQQVPDNEQATEGMARVEVALVDAIDASLSAGKLGHARKQLGWLQALPGTEQGGARLQDRLDTLQQVRPLLSDAVQLMDAGKQLAPAGDDANALAVYRQVLGIDSGNTVAREGIADIQKHALNRALAAAAQHDRDAVQSAMVQARRIQPHSTALQDTRDRIERIRQRRAGNVLDDAHAALDAGDLHLAQTLAARAASIGSTPQAGDAFDRRLRQVRLYAGHEPGRIFRDRFRDRRGRAPAMVVLATGQFMMGASAGERDHRASESPRHSVRIDNGFAMARHEVTVGQFREFVAGSDYTPDSETLGGASVYSEHTGGMRTDPDATWKDDYAGEPAGNTMPVVNVSWRDAHAYAQWLSERTGHDYALPTEAQFAYALRAGTDTRYWWGDSGLDKPMENVSASGDISASGRHWTHAFADYSDGYWGTAPVAHFAANPFGLYDMAGNVAEWTRDCWHDNYTRAPADGTAWINPGCGTRVVRGGSWGSAPEQVRSAWRRGIKATKRSGRTGFRVIRQF